jgi:hypothetical protein
MGTCLWISNVFTFAISVFGIAVSAIYICHQLFRSAKQPNYDEELEKALTELLKEDEKEKTPNTRLGIIIEDYKASNSEIGRRDTITLLVGTILVTSSLVILGTTAKEILGTIAEETLQNFMGIWASVSIGLFLIFLFALHDTGKRLNGLTFDRIKAIEQALTNHFNPNSGKEQHEGYEFGIHSYLHRKTKEQREWWLRLRRTFWADVLMLLSIGWLLLSIT